VAESYSRARVVAETVDGFRDSRAVYRTRFVLMDGVSGEPRRREPGKAEGWGWYRWESLPNPCSRRWCRCCAQTSAV
jgi:hypothetical protein